MGQPAAKMGDQITGLDTHIYMIPAAAGAPVPTPLPSPFAGMINGGCSTDVNIEGKPAATVGSTAVNNPPHMPQGGPFQVPPTNQGTIIMGSSTVMINGKPAARAGDTANTCNDPTGVAPVGTVVAAGTVNIG
ncbi:PAAR domain-containing protein [Methanocella sp. MCL-LM]|uniref:PAAR domain-containing protein n=1 Tax=Methanocella sp. MCL-LM TaxID=3412035 RepID=UPI003C7641E9